MGARADLSTSGLVFFEAGTDFLSAGVYMLRALSSTREKGRATAAAGVGGEAAVTTWVNQKERKETRKNGGGGGVYILLNNDCQRKHVPLNNGRLEIPRRRAQVSLVFVVYIPYRMHSRAPLETLIPAGWSVLNL